MMGGSAVGLPQGTKMDILRLHITRAGQAGSGLPERLAAPGFLAIHDAVNSRRPRRFNLTMHMVGLINGRTFEIESVAPDEVVRLGDLEVSLAVRGIRLVLSGDRVELATAPEAGELIARYTGADPAPRLSPAALETLAIVAYGQPITRAGVERIRGVDSDYTVRALLHRRLIVELGRSEAPGRPYLYGTGFDFLERFGLTSLDELPPLDSDAAVRVEEGGQTTSQAEA